MTCLAVRVGAAAIVGYSLGALTDNVVVAGVLAVVAAAAMYLWSRVASARAGEACTTGSCATSWRGRRRAAVRLEPPLDAGPGAAGPHRQEAVAATAGAAGRPDKVGTGAAAHEAALVEPRQGG